MRRTDLANLRTPSSTVVDWVMHDVRTFCWSVGMRVRARWSASARWGEGACDRVAIGVCFGFGEVVGCAGVMRVGGGFGAECGGPLVPRRGVSWTAGAVAWAGLVDGRP